jgi:hypothetical protein
MLKEKQCHEGGKSQPIGMDKEAKADTDKGQRRGVCFDRSLDVPFFIQFPQASADLGSVVVGIAIIAPPCPSN